MNSLQARRVALAGFAIALALQRATIAPAAAPKPAILAALEASAWRLEGARAALPPLQASRRERLEMQDFVQLLYDGGALRLCASSPQGREIFAILADTREPRRREFAVLTNTEQYVTHHDGPYVVVLPVRPITQERFERLKLRRWTERDLTRQLGAPSYRWHVHGIGFFGLTYVPEGLTFIGDFPERIEYQLFKPFDEEKFDFGLPPLSYLADLDYATLQADTRRGFASKLTRQRREIDDVLAKGKPSPDGRFVVSHVNLGGLANTEEIVIRERGKPERRYPAESFVKDDEYVWLDSRTILLRVVSDDVEFHTMNAATGAARLVARVRKRNVTAFAVSGPRTFSYTTDDGLRHLVRVRDPRGRLTPQRR